MHLQDDASGKGAAIFLAMPGAISCQPDGRLEIVALRNATCERAFGFLPVLGLPAVGHEESSCAFDYALLFTDAGDWRDNKIPLIARNVFDNPWDTTGSAGLREHQACEQGIKVSTGTVPYRGLGKAHAMGEIAGMVKVIADAASDKVLGVHICGARAADIVHEGALAITMGATARQLGAMIHAHPTFAEGIMESAEDVHRSAIHLPKEGAS